MNFLYLKLLQKENGSTLIEYGYTLALVMVICVTAVALIGTKLVSYSHSVGSSISLLINPV